MQKQLLFIISLILIINTKIFSQGGACNNWYFGIKAGLTFNTTPPTPITTNSLINVEGCASVSDAMGNILFYTEGTVVYDKTNTIMPNGSNLFGHPSSSQSSIIVPKPGTFNASLNRYNNYYIITVDYNAGSSAFGIPGEGTRGVCYSEVDMTLNLGNGDIVTATKNTHLFGTHTTEKITATQHANGCDYWIIGRPTFSTDFYSYHVSATGINTVAVVSSIPSSNFNPPLAPGVGSMKVSPNGKLLAMINGYDPDPTTAPYECGLFVYDFNNATGILSPKFWSIGSGGTSASGAGGAYPYAFGINRLGYGVEFSSNSNLIYTTGLPGNVAISRTIQQYDLTSSTTSAFQLSRQTIGTTTSPVGDNNYTACALQLAPDGKIYVALDKNDSIGVINNPNTLGVGCGYSDRSVPVGGGTKVSKYGLPNFISTLVSPINKILMLDNCVTNSVRFNLLDTSKVLAYNWSFSPLSSSSTTISTSTSFSTSVNFPASGEYVATLNLTYMCYSRILRDTFNIGPPTFTVTGAVTPICSGQTKTLIINSISGTHNYSWLSGTVPSTGTLVTASPSSSQGYTVNALSVNGCTNNATFTITVNQNPILAISSTQSVSCFGNNTGSVTIVSSGGAGTGYTLTPTSTTSLSAGTHTYTLVDANGCSTQTTVLISQPSSSLSGSVSSISSNTNCTNYNGSVALFLSGGTPSYSILWDNGATTNPVTNLNTGTHSYTITDINNCVSTETVNVAGVLTPTSSLVSQTNPSCISANNGVLTFSIAPSSVGFSYSLTSASFSSTNTTGVFSGLSSGVYSVTVGNVSSNCINEQTVSLVPASTINFTTNISNNTVLCFGDSSLVSVSTSGGTSPYSYTWSNGATTNTTTIAVGNYTIETIDALGCQKTETIVVSGPSAVLTISQSLVTSSCLNKPTGGVKLTASGGTPNYNFAWSNGSNSNQLENIASGSYTVVISDANNCTLTQTLLVPALEKFDLSCIEIVIPEIFTPNGDGRNDKFEIMGISNFPNNKIQIFNRWGSLIYKKEAYMNEWDGKANVSDAPKNALLPAGTYYVVFDFGDNSSPIYHGYLQLAY